MKLINWLRRIFYLLTYWLRPPRIYVTQITSSGKGNFIDIRYWLTRPDIEQENTRIFLVDKKSGQRLNLMRLTKYGLIKTKHNKYRNTGFLLFYNQNQVVQKGSEVDLYFDRLKAENIKVE